MAMEKIIIVNSGSVSKKYALYQGEELLLSAHFEELPTGFQVHLKKGETYSKSQKILEEDFNAALDYFIDFLIDTKIIVNEKDISGVAFRIVAPGLFFQEDKIIDKNYLSKLDETSENSLIHVSAMREQMNQVLDRLPKVPFWGISDSFFHSTKPKYASRYAISNKITSETEMYRFGYHGISVSSIVEKLKKQDKFAKKVIVCHLGGGSSLTAVLDGKSIENSMGYTPLEGIPMATRSGSIDAGAVLFIMDYKKYDPVEMKEFLSYKSGLLAISEFSSDIRDLIDASEKNNDQATLALDMYIYAIKAFRL